MRAASAPEQLKQSLNRKSNQFLNRKISPQENSTPKKHYKSHTAWSIVYCPSLPWQRQPHSWTLPSRINLSQESSLVSAEFKSLSVTSHRVLRKKLLRYFIRKAEQNRRREEPGWYFPLVGLNKA